MPSIGLLYSKGQREVNNMETSLCCLAVKKRKARRQSVIGIVADSEYVS